MTIFGRMLNNQPLAITHYYITTYANKTAHYIIGTNFAHPYNAMVAEYLQPDDVSVLTTQHDWAWPEALRDIFRPRGINLLVADGIDQFINVLRHRRIQAAIVDTDATLRSGASLRNTSRDQGGLWPLRIIRVEYPLMPCILLTSNPTGATLEEALQLDAFSVVDKPVDMKILKDQLNRLFVRKYSSHIFSA